MADTATNPQTGERVQLVNGQWIPIPKATIAERVKKDIQKTAKEKVDFDFGTMVSNIPESGVKYGEDIANMVMNPIDTAKGLGQVAIGGVQKLIPGQAEEDALIPNYEPVADAVGDYFGDRYGGVDEFKTTLMEDPVGVLGDTAGALGGVGMLPKLGKIGQLGSLLDPANIALRGGSKAISNMPMLSKVPEGLYASSAKIPTKFDESAVIKTALEQGIMPTPGGLAKADDIINSLNTKVSGLIDASSISGEYVPASVVFKTIDDVKQEFGGFKFDAPDDIAKIDAEVAKFKSHLDARNTDFVSIKELQKFKSSLYKTIDFKRKNQKGTPVDEAMRKNMAKAAKAEIENYIPEVKDLNLQMGDMLELVDSLQQPSARIGRRDILGLGTAAKTTAGGVAGGVPGAVTGFLIGIADNPTNKARVALGIQKIKKQNISMAKKRVLTVELLRNEAAMQNQE